MTCITLFATPMAMATTQLARVICSEVVTSRQVEPKAVQRSLHMSWVVVIDERGKRELRMCWATG